MRRHLIWFWFLPVITGSVALASAIGSGTIAAVTPTVSAFFVQAFGRGIFRSLVNATPPADVVAFGSTGLKQEFTSLANSSQKGALIMPDPTNPSVTWQVYPAIYPFYNTLSVGTAGYPTMDTATCPLSNTFGTCSYQVLSLNYAIFSYSLGGANFSVADPVYTEWNNSGALTGLGAATSALIATTSKPGTAGSIQLFSNGAVYQYPTGATTPSTYAVGGTIYTTFTSAGGQAVLGFPKADEVVLASGTHQQNFENGQIQFIPGGTPTILFPIQQIQVSDNISSFFTTTVTLQLGATLNLAATVFDTQGNPVTDRTLSWTTSNGSAITVQSSGYTAVLKAVGPGSANITASAGGVVSNVIPVQVPSQCCSIGQGAPTQTMTQAFQSAVTRNKLAAAPLSSAPVTRAGNGYVQLLTAASGGGTYAVSEADQSSIAYVISGGLYAAYLASGGFSGPLGYPSSDASPGGTQSFLSGAALAGSPVTLIPIPIASKWLASGAETGPLGAPAGNATAFTSLSGVNGSAQVFAGGSIYGIASGSRAGQAYISSGPILAQYLSLSGPAGNLGIPIGDIVSNGGVLQQDFETGSLLLAAGASTATVKYNPRFPAITVTPASVAPGGVVHVDVAGFAFGAKLAITTSGQTAAFAATAPLGQFAWNIAIPANAAPGVASIQAKASTGTDTASGSYTVVPVAQLRPALKAISGDLQTGAPGATLTAPLVARLTDATGNPVPGVAVSYNALPGTVVNGPPLTDSNGMISASVRLQLSLGATGISIVAGGQVVTFTALSTANSITGFPSFTQADAQGGFVAAMAAAIRYYQNSGTLPAPNGLASVATLAQYLSANAGFTPTANPWVAMRYAGVAGGLSVESATLDRIRDLVSAGSPLVLELAVAIDGGAAGGATVDATGVTADGSVTIMDPNPLFGRSSLADYLAGFSAQGHTIQATVTGVLRIVSSAITPLGFVAATPVSAAASANSTAGACPAIDILNEAPAIVDGTRFIACDGSLPPYQLTLRSSSSAAILDLGNASQQQIAPTATSTYQLVRTNSSLVSTPQTLVISGIVNSAGLKPGLSPGGLFSIFGQGFAAGANLSTVTVGGKKATILAETPFQINAQMPLALTGSQPVQVTGPLGSLTQNVTLTAAAPGIFVIGSAADSQPLGAIVNQDGTINSATNPVPRGQFVSIYGTGLGPTVAQGSLQSAVAAVTVSIAGGAPLKPSFAGLAPSIPGLYQVNVQIPATTTPGSEVTLSITAGAQTSNTVVFAVE